MLQRRIFLLILAIGMVGLAATGGVLADSDDGVHRLALQVSDNDPQKMNAVLNVAANVSRYYSEIGEEVEIEIVAFNRGLHMLRQDTSPVAERITNFSQSMPNVTFQACGNTLTSMTKKEGKAPPLFEFAQHVQAGVVRLIELNEAGWTIVRP
jgi:hypothetical protein